MYEGRRPYIGVELFPETVVEAFLEHTLCQEEDESEGEKAIEYEAHKEAGTLLKRVWDPQPVNPLAR